jgi:hypothetical protein
MSRISGWRHSEKANNQTTTKEIAKVYKGYVLVSELILDGYLGLIINGVGRNRLWFLLLWLFGLFLLFSSQHGSVHHAPCVYLGGGRGVELLGDFGGFDLWFGHSRGLLHGNDVLPGHSVSIVRFEQGGGCVEFPLDAGPVIE